jgi:hypothetical protein
MVAIMALWLPILVSAVLVFLASSIVHMVIPLHKSDYRKLPAENDVMESLRKFGIPPGDYLVPCPEGPQAMRDPGFIEKRSKGPVIVMTVMKSGPPAMGPSLVKWFLYCVVVGVIAAYVTGRALAPGTPYLQVFRFAGTTAFACYALALPQDSIWYQRSWGTTFRYMFDGLIYGSLTAGAFGWLWPR